MLLLRHDILKLFLVPLDVDLCVALFLVFLIARLIVPLQVAALCGACLGGNVSLQVAPLGIACLGNIGIDLFVLSKE